LLLATPRQLSARNTTLVDAFRCMDTDCSGQVQAQELSAALSALGLGITGDRAAALVHALDRTGNGKISCFDRTGNSKISCFEFIRMVGSAGREPGGEGEGREGAGAGGKEGRAESRE